MIEFERTEIEEHEYTDHRGKMPCSSGIGRRGKEISRDGCSCSRDRLPSNADIPGLGSGICGFTDIQDLKIFGMRRISYEFEKT